MAIARALATGPRILLADEPTGNLDAHSTDEVLGLFDALNAEGRTVIVITHEDEVARRARRLIRVADGRIVADGPVPVDGARGHGGADEVTR